ncbi:MAG: hypothetical protein JWO62_1854 [Acidimicrobiaceae bacterium]|jgi:hypothetical protein|nr:hypothetical protein [Acidimicrobiaceae bacterium]
MATNAQRSAARKNIEKATATAKAQKTIARTARSTLSALAKQRGAVAQRDQTGGDTPHTRQQLYEEARQRDVPGRS